MTLGESCDGDHCITCGDDGIPMTVALVDHRQALAVCTDETGGRHAVETTLVDPVSRGDRVLVHAGVAIVALGDEARA